MCRFSVCIFDIWQLLTACASVTYVNRLEKCDLGHYLSVSPRLATPSFQSLSEEQTVQLRKFLGQTTPCEPVYPIGDRCNILLYDSGIRVRRFAAVRKNWCLCLPCLSQVHRLVLASRLVFSLFSTRLHSARLIYLALPTSSLASH